MKMTELWLSFVYLKFTFLTNVIFIKTIGSPPSGIADLSRFLLSCLDPLVVFCLQTLLNCLAFKSFDVERT